MQRLFRFWAVPLALALVATLVVAPSATAQTIRGGMQGAVTDDTGAPLPGVTVTLRSPAMQGERLEVTDANGGFRFNAIPAGVYSAAFNLEGFQQIEQIDIRVNINQTVRMEVELPAAYSDELVVTSERPVVDTGTTELGLNIDSDFFLDIPTQRNANAIARVAPGAQQDASGTTFYGSSGAENAYYIDGVNTTGIELGQEGKTLNFEFIQEVQVKTAGYSAEYGRAIGGLINVITKSGGNEFQGDVFGYYDDIQNSLSGAAKAGPITGSRHTKEFTRSDIGVDIGGPIAKDKLWFFAAYNVVDNENTLEVLDDFSIVGGPTTGDTFSDQTDRDLWAAKLTWQAAAGHSFCILRIW